MPSVRTSAGSRCFAASGWRAFQRSRPSVASAFEAARLISMTGMVVFRRPVGVGREPPGVPRCTPSHSVGRPAFLSPAATAAARSAATSGGGPPSTRVRARTPISEYEPGRGVEGGPPPEVAAERAGRWRPEDRERRPADRVGRCATRHARRLASDADRPRETTIPVIEISRAASKAEATEGLERWKARQPGGGERLATSLTDGTTQPAPRSGIASGST